MAKETLAFPQLEITALKSHRYLGYVTITHPFHPLKGERLKVLSSKTFNKRDILSLQNLCGSMLSVPREWTDKADPDPYRSCPGYLEDPPVLSFMHLMELTDLLSGLRNVQPCRSKKIKNKS